MKKLNFPKSVKKFIRTEKARIRRLNQDKETQDMEIIQLIQSCIERYAKKAK